MTILQSVWRLSISTGSTSKRGEVLHSDFTINGSCPSTSILAYSDAQNLKRKPPGRWVPLTAVTCSLPKEVLNHFARCAMPSSWPFFWRSAIMKIDRGLHPRPPVHIRGLSDGSDAHEGLRAVDGERRPFHLDEVEAKKVNATIASHPLPCAGHVPAREVERVRSFNVVASRRPVGADRPPPRPVVEGGPGSARHPQSAHRRSQRQRQLPLRGRLCRAVHKKVHPICWNECSISKHTKYSPWCWLRVFKVVSKVIDLEQTPIDNVESCFPDDVIVKIHSWDAHPTDGNECWISTDAQDSLWCCFRIFNVSCKVWELK